MDKTPISTDILINELFKFLDIDDITNMISLSKEYNNIDIYNNWITLLKVKYPLYHEFLINNNMDNNNTDNNNNIIKEMLYAISNIKTYKELIKETKIQKEKKTLYGMFRHYEYEEEEEEIDLYSLFVESCKYMRNHLSVFLFENVDHAILFVDYESLNMACKCNNIVIAKLIVESNSIRVFSIDKKLLNCSFYYACLNGHVELFNILLDYYVYTYSIDEIQFLYPPKLTRTTISGTEYMKPFEYHSIETLACKSCNVNMVNIFFTTPFIHINCYLINNIIIKAAKYGNYDIFKYLITNENVKNMEKQKYGDVDILKYYENTKLNKRTLNICFVNACCHGNYDIMIYLLNISSVKVTYNHGFAFKSACQNGHTKIVQHLLKPRKYQARGSINPAFNNSEALNNACINDNDDIVALLLKDERVNPMMSGKKILLTCIQNQQGKCLKLILNNENVLKYLNTNDNIRIILDEACDMFNMKNIIEILLNDKRLIFNNISLKYLKNEYHTDTNINLLLIKDIRIVKDEDDINKILTDIIYVQCSNIKYELMMNDVLDVIKLQYPDFKFQDIKDLMEKICREGWFNIFKRLIEDFKIKLPSTGYCCYLNNACSSDNIDLVKYIIHNLGFNIEECDYICNICRLSSTYILSYIINETDIDLNCEHNQALFQCAYSKNFDSIVMLLKSSRFKKLNDIEQYIYYDEDVCKDINLILENAKNIIKKANKNNRLDVVELMEKYVNS